MLAHICLVGLEGPFEPTIPRRLQQHFSAFAAELAAARKRVLAQTGFAIHQRAVTDVTARKMNRAKKVVSERPLGPVRLVIGDIRGASRPFRGVVVGEESLDRYYKHDPYTAPRPRPRPRSRSRITAPVSVKVSVTAHGHGHGLGTRSRTRSRPRLPALLFPLFFFQPFYCIMQLVGHIIGQNDQVLLTGYPGITLAPLF